MEPRSPALSHGIPVHILTQQGRNPSIVPDALIANIALPAVVETVGGRRGAVQPARSLLFDVKTIHLGTEHYSSLRARQEQSGAVHARELQVSRDYRAHARRLDRDHSPAGTTPILQRLDSFGRTRGLVFGNFGEASADVHSLLETVVVNDQEVLKQCPFSTTWHTRQ